ncbi:MAG: hypothetical protein R3D58_20470 [Saprospiraceae bacterium]|nr:hypothetical protein [Lewinellaceae bacterium]
MLNKIKNLDELLAEKARLQAQIDLVQGELNLSSRRTREAFKEILEDKLNIPKQLGQLFQGGSQESVQGSVINAIGKVAGLGSWWSGLLSAFVPMVIDFVTGQIKRRKERRAENPDPETDAPPQKAKPKRRNPFKRKKATPPAEPDNA